MTPEDVHLRYLLISKEFLMSLLNKTVEWTSQSAGISTTKRGVVIYDGDVLKVASWRNIRDIRHTKVPKELYNGRGFFKYRHKADYLASDGRP